MRDDKPQSQTDNGSAYLSASAGRPLAVGTSVPRFDAYAKVIGTEKFAADYYAENMVWAGVKKRRSPARSCQVHRHQRGSQTARRAASAHS